MDLACTEEEEAFRAGLRHWLSTALPALPPRPPPGDWPARRAHDRAWQRALYDAGYAGVHWDASPTRRLIFLEETEEAGAPYVGANFVGLLHAGPTIAAEGTPEQRARWLPPILRGDEIWCQGFSEPDAGSDLASLRTRAVRDGDAYVVTGAKVWTSHAEIADWCELLVRTDPEAPRHRGISWLAMPMDAPGVTVRPLRTLAGSTEFAEVFLDEVRVPAANRVGEENDGWRVTMVTLSFERGTAFAGEVVACRRTLAALARTARENGRWDDTVLRRRLGRLNAEFRALWRLVQFNVAEAEATGGVPGAGGSVFKLRYSEARRELYDTAAAVLGPDALDLSRGWTIDRLSSLSYTIAAGTSQIQRNIVAERILGLPKER
ncbi:acyl-CoA dehydrogenase family protein [Streptomyces pacificus]|uniref:Acyl-CoA dehydrogenase n=1 Tax=Streptomyces pacificus TaxID=2705029 RepID=A0A6A0AWU0_9ACTN|nr:acyl-CoA dehydrogenase family protein [Streptomyces pacificus]GFH36895.1 acyl-CoA dehydrogenase [Streptomyces pacificus]